MNQETWRVKMARLGIQYQEQDRKVHIIIDGERAATIRPDERRSGAGGYIFRHVIEYRNAAHIDLADDLNHATDIIAHKYRYTSQAPRPYTGR